MTRLLRPLFLTALLAAAARGSFEPVPSGARAAGLARSLDAVPDDAFGLWTNPAGMILLERPELATTYGQPFTGLSDGSRIVRAGLTYVQPSPLKFRNSAYGVGYFSSGAGGLYREQTVSLALAQEFGDRLTLSLAGKLLRRTFESIAATDVNTGNPLGASDPVVQSDRSASQLTLDTGALWKLNGGGRLGLSARQWTRPNLALGSGFDPAPLILDLGWAQPLGGFGLSLGLTQTRQENQTSNAAGLGVERWLAQRFGVRGGFRMGSEDLREAALGLGYRAASLQVDYAYAQGLGSGGDLSSQHIVSLTYRFGDAPAPLVQPRRTRAPAPAQEPEPAGEPAPRDPVNLPAILLDPTTPPDPEEQDRNAQTLEAYAALVRRGAPVPDRAAFLSAVILDYETRGLDASLLQAELARLEKSQENAPEAYRAFLDYYRTNLVQATPEEKAAYLDWLQAIYEPLGLDLSDLRRERSRLGSR